MKIFPFSQNILGLILLCDMFVYRLFSYVRKIKIFQKGISLLLIPLLHCIVFGKNEIICCLHVKISLFLWNISLQRVHDPPHPPSFLLHKAPQRDLVGTCYQVCRKLIAEKNCFLQFRAKLSVPSLPPCTPFPCCASWWKARCTKKLLSSSTRFVYFYLCICIGVLVFLYLCFCIYLAVSLGKREMFADKVKIWFAWFVFWK